MTEEAMGVIEQAVKKVGVRDPELVAMHKVRQVLEGLAPQSALRVLEWNREKSVEELHRRIAESGSGASAGEPGKYALQGSKVRHIDPNPAGASVPFAPAFD